MTIPKVSDADLVRLHKARVPIREIMRHFGYNHAESIRLRERKLGLPPRKPGGGPRRITVEEALNGRSFTHRETHSAQS